ncbi:MAG: hypothetical protein GY832_47435 [Chloroflexi bacterium]|nr:hypothetical protein [Chloroflexota bacterium]
MMTSSKLRAIVQVLSLALLIAILLGLGSNVVATPLSQEGGLFADAVVESDSDLSDDPKIIRARFVELNFEMLGGVGDAPAVGTLELNLFDDVTFTAVLDRAKLNPSGSFSWIGHLEGIEYGSVILVVRGGVMVGSVNMPGAFYKIRHVSDGVHAIQEMDSGAFPPEGEPIAVLAPRDALGEALVAPTADDGSIVDVLVVYTDDARAAVGGITVMENLIDQAIDETNTSYVNSGVAQRVNLVHAAEVAYDESGFNWSTTLSRLRGTSDGYIDNVHTLRDTYCADEVVLIVNDAAYCGLAYLMWNVSSSFEDDAFALVHWDCATGYYSFAHEMGHNMGARHDWYVDSETTPYAYNHGYLNAPDRWRTIMAYNSDCTAQGFNCDRIQYWSNPGVLRGGDPMGVPSGTSSACNTGVSNPNCDADNQLLLDNTAYTVSNFRDSSVCVPSTFSISGYVRDSSGTGLSGVMVDFGGARPAVTTDSSGYYSQSEFEEDDYIVGFTSSGYFFSPVEDQVTVSGADVTHNTTGYTAAPASLPFYDGFENGGLGDAWAVETNYDGRVRVSSDYPNWGRSSLLLDNAVESAFNFYASAILALDLSNETQVDMSFWWQDFGDEDHSDDGVFVSDDLGVTWHQVVSFSGGVEYTYTQTILDLDDAASTAGISLTNPFLVKFQFYDNSPINPDGASDGYGIDDVIVNTASSIGPLAYATHTIDDEPTGTFSNNGDGIVNCGEAIGLYALVYNQGGSTVTLPTVTITTTDPYITFISDTVSSYPSIAGLGMDVNNTGFDLYVSPDIPFVHSVQFSIEISATNGGPWSDDFDVHVRCGYAYVYLPLLFRVYPPTPATPVLNVISNSDGDGNYTVSWGAAVRADTYTLQEDDNASFTSPVAAYSGTGTSIAITDKSIDTYHYRVKATNAWGDSGWSSVQSVTVQPSGPTPGFWASTYDEFYVTSDRAYVDDFATYISVDNCGSYKITHTIQEPISNNQFSFTGSFYANGTFSDATHCSGQDGLDYFYIAGCGYISGGPWNYSATWQSSDTWTIQPFRVAERVSAQAVGIPNPAFRVEKIGD